MSTLAVLLLPIIVISHLTAQWYLFRFIGYHALAWMRGPRKERRPESVASKQGVAQICSFFNSKMNKANNGVPSIHVSIQQPRH